MRLQEREQLVALTQVPDHEVCQGFGELYRKTSKLLWPTLNCQLHEKNIQVATNETIWAPLPDKQSTARAQFS